MKCVLSLNEQKMSKRLTGLNPLVKWEIKGSIPFYSTMKFTTINKKEFNKFYKELKKEFKIKKEYLKKYKNEQKI